MIRGLRIFVLAACLCMVGCNSDTAEDQTYDDLAAKYEQYTVSGLWDDLAGSEEANGSYILLKGAVFSIQDKVVTLMDSSSNKTVECTFSSDTDISTLAEDDTVTIAGICHFATGTSSYPYLGSCDYLYVHG